MKYNWSPHRRSMSLDQIPDSLLRCPNCGSRKVVPIVYGLPGEDLMERASKGLVELGGCIVSSGQPTVVCRACRHRWRWIREWGEPDPFPKFMVSEELAREIDETISRIHNEIEQREDFIKKLRGDVEQDKELVYGEIEWFEGSLLVFIPNRRAAELAAVQEALWTTTTWGDFRAHVPLADYVELVLLSDLWDGELDLNSPPVVDDALTFIAMDISCVADGDWPESPLEAMASWLPDDVIEECGKAEFMRSGEKIIMFDPENKSQIICRLEKSGFTCQQDDEVVKRACGEIKGT